MTRRRASIVVLSFVVLWTSGAICAAQTNNSSAPSLPPPHKIPAPPTTAQATNIPYYTLRDGMSSTLTLNNIAPAATTVTVTIYSMEGKAHVLEPITLNPHSYKQIDLSSVVPSEEFSAGNIQVAYTSIAMGVTCQVSITSLEKRVSFESREPYEMQDMGDMMPFMSTNLAGILSLPGPGAAGFLAVTNVGANEDSVEISLGSKQRSMKLHPRQTRLLNLNNDFDQRGPGAAVVKLQYTGLPGDIATTGFVLDLQSGYSSAFTMFDPSLDRSSHLSGAHLRIGRPEPTEGFPEGTRFHSPLLLGNLTEKPITAHIIFDYTVKQKVQMTPTDPSRAEATENEFKTVPVGDVSIPAGGVQRIELSSFADRVEESPIVEAGVDVDYDGAPGALVGNLVSVDETGDYAFEVPVKDPAAVTEGMDGIYPWTLEDGTRTVVHIKNTTNQPASALLTLDYYDNGAFKTYRHPRIELNPYQTVAIDIQELKDSKKPDLLGQLFSATATQGQAQWRQVTPYSLIGRAEQTNVKQGIARSFSCNENCCIYYNEWPYLSPSLTGDVSGNGTIDSYISGYDCNDIPFGPNLSSDVSGWTSQNTSIASLSSCANGNDSCDVLYQGGGTTDVQATQGYLWYNSSQADCNCNQHLHDYTLNAAQVTVLVPTSLSIVSGTSSTTSEAKCGNGTQCGVSRSFTYQVNDQNGHALQVPGYEIWDAFGTPSPNGLNMGSFTTTCTPANTGPCGQVTNGSGQFHELSLVVCASACYSAPSCTTGGGAYSQVTQTWHVGPSSINQTVKFYCDHVTVNGL